MLKIVLLLLVASAVALHVGKPDTHLVQKPKKHHQKKHKLSKPAVEELHKRTDDDIEVCNKINHQIGDDRTSSTMMEECSQDGSGKACDILQSGKPSEKKAEASTQMKETYGKCLADMKNKDGTNMFEQVPKDCVDDMADSSVEMFCDFGMALSPRCEEMAKKVMKEKNDEIEECGTKNDFNKQLFKAMDGVDSADFVEGQEAPESLVDVAQRLMETCVKLSPECNEQFSYIVAGNAKQASMEAFADKIGRDGLRSAPPPVHNIVVLFKKPEKTSSSHLLKLLTHGSVV